MASSHQQPRQQQQQQAFASTSYPPTSRQGDHPATAATMARHENWAGSGYAASANPDLLTGMALFDSPLSEMVDNDFGDDFDFDMDAFVQQEMAPAQLGFDLEGSREGMNMNTTAFPVIDPPAVAGYSFNDFQLFPDEDPTFGLDPTGFNFTALPPVSILPHFDAPSSSLDNSPFSNYVADASPFTNHTASPTSTNGSDALGHPYQCTTDGCTKTFRKDSQLKQHQRVHRKSLVCTICRAERQTEHRFAQTRDLERHMQARHKDAAKHQNVRSETRDCPFPGCEHRGRRDNVSRHYESKHGGKLMWRKGVPSLV